MPPQIPLNAPSRTELWQRQWLALSLLSHRGYLPETARLVERVLRGERIDSGVDGSRSG